MFYWFLSFKNIVLHVPLQHDSVRVYSPCFLDIFQAGPSSDRSTSIGLSLVALPNVICVNIKLKKIISIIVKIHLSYILSFHFLVTKQNTSTLLLFNNCF